MEIKTETVKTYWLSMTETQARDLIDVAIMGKDDDAITPSAQETLNTIRQALLTAGLKRNAD